MKNPCFTKYFIFTPFWKEKNIYFTVSDYWSVHALQSSRSPVLLSDDLIAKVPRTSAEINKDTVKKWDCISTVRSSLCWDFNFWSWVLRFWYLYGEFSLLVVELSMKIYGAFLKSFVCITLRDRTKGFKRHLGLKLCETKQFRCIQCRNYLIVSSSPNSPPLLLILTLLVYSIGRYFLSSLHSRIENFVRSDEFSFFITNPHGNNHPPPRPPTQITIWFWWLFQVRYLIIFVTKKLDILWSCYLNK